MLAPAAELPRLELFVWEDKLAHLVLFFVLQLLAARSFGRWTERAVAGAAAAALAYAALLEAAQLAVPGRAWEIRDLAAAAVGVGLAALYLGARRSPRRGHAP